MFLFLNLHASPGTVEPDVPPSQPLAPSSSQSKPPPSAFYPSSFTAYLADWDLSREAALRKAACLLAFALHVPLNVIGVISRGISLFMFIGVILSVLNLVCVALALWRVDRMGGRRVAFGGQYTRTHFDGVILYLLVTYGASLAAFVFAPWWVVRIVWLFLILSDVVAFIAGWVASWADVGVGLV